MKDIFIAETDENNKVLHVWFSKAGYRAHPVRLIDLTGTTPTDAEFKGARRLAILDWLRLYFRKTGALPAVWGA